MKLRYSANYRFLARSTGRGCPITQGFYAIDESRFKWFLQPQNNPDKKSAEKREDDVFGLRSSAPVLSASLRGLSLPRLPVIRGRPVLPREVLLEKEWRNRPSVGIQGGRHVGESR